MSSSAYAFTRTYFEMIPLKLTFLELKFMSLVLISVSLCKSNSFKLMYLSVAIFNQYHNIPLKHFPVKNYTKLKNSLQIIVFLVTLSYICMKL